MNNEATAQTGTETPAAVAQAATPAKTPKAPKASKPKASKPKASKPKAVKAKPAKKGKAKVAVAKGTKGPGVLRQYAPQYHKDATNKTAGGNVSVDNDDPIAKKLRGMPLDAVYSLVSKALEVPATQLKAKYANLNVGMQRMNLGNRYRASQR